MKRTFLIILSSCFGLFVQASEDPEAGIEAINDTASILTDYLPYITDLCYALAAIIAILGSFSIYFAYVHGHQEIKKKILMVVGSCIMFLSMAVALPEFFGIENNGYSHTGGYVASNPTGSVSSNDGDHLNGTVPNVSDMSETSGASYASIAEQVQQYDGGKCIKSGGTINYDACMFYEGDYNPSISIYRYEDVYAMLNNNNGDFQKVYEDLSYCYNCALDAEEPGPYSARDYWEMMTACEDIANAVWNCLPSGYVNGNLRDLIRQRLLM